MSLLTSDQWRAVLVAARAGNAALMASAAFAQPGHGYSGPNVEHAITEAFGELVREGKVK